MIQPADLANAITLRDFAQRRGIVVPREILKRIALAQSLAGQAAPLETEADFYESFALLAQSLLPVTLVTIAAPPKIKDPQWLAVILVALLFFLGLIYCHENWYRGTFVTSKIEQAAALHQAADKAQDANAVATVLSPAEIDNDHHELAATRELCDWINRPLLEDQTSPFYHEKVIEYLDDANLDLQIDYGYILPLLYGILGSLMYCSTALYQEYRKFGVFVSTNLLVIIMRVYLGAIAGITVGWFWTPTTSSGSAGASGIADLPSQSLTPFALAFVVGFSVEAFISLLTRLANTMTESTKPADKTA